MNNLLENASLSLSSWIIGLLRLNSLLKERCSLGFIKAPLSVYLYISALFDSISYCYILPCSHLKPKNHTIIKRNELVPPTFTRKNILTAIRLLKWSRKYGPWIFPPYRMRKEIKKKLHEYPEGPRDGPNQILFAKLTKLKVNRCQIEKWRKISYSMR